ncbi:hypothetical protein ACFLQL_00815, partial [Verrucomicrobiota bacterium]
MHRYVAVFFLVVAPIWADELSVALKPSVEIEETAYTYEPSTNGSFPLWTYGSTVLARRGKTLFMNATETLPGIKSTCRVRWSLMTRGPDGWTVLQRDPKDRTREPSPIGVTTTGR